MLVKGSVYLGYESVGKKAGIEHRKVYRRITCGRGNHSHSPNLEEVKCTSREVIATEQEGFLVGRKDFRTGLSEPCRM